MLTDEQRQIQDAAARFADDLLRPNAGRWDLEKHFPVEELRAEAALGFAGIYVSEESGGAGLSRLDAVLVFEQLARGCIATSAYLSIHNMCAFMIDRFGNAEQKARFLPSLVRMEHLASYCLTEPGAGSDAASLSLRARRDGGDYVLSGTKSFISGAGASDIYVVMARTGEQGAKGISAFVVEKEAPGLSFGANEKKMGWNAQPTRQVMFDEVRVPVANRLGGEGEGFGFAMEGLNGGRLNIAACSLGGAQDAFDRALCHAKDRRQFGHAIIDFQAQSFRLADMKTKLEASRCLLYDAAQHIDLKSNDAAVRCAMAKRFVTDECFTIADEALQIHGGYGYLHDYGIERIVRDLRVHRILEGTNDIMRVIIARDIKGRSPHG